MNESAIPVSSPGLQIPATSIKRVLLVVKETYLDQVRARGDEHLLGEIAARKPGLENVEESHRQHQNCIKLVTDALLIRGLEVDKIHRYSDVLKDRLTGVGLVVTIGGDGTLLRASHDLGSDIPVVGVNSAPITSFGHYCCTNGEGFAAVLDQILDGSFQPSRLLRLSLDIDGTPLSEPVLNEVLVAHKNPAGTSRYHMSVAGQLVQHKCSGLLIAPPAGSTGFSRSEGGIILPITARQYTFIERAPFLKIGEAPEMKSGVVDGSDQIRIVSQMQDGKLFIDGDHIEYDFPRGATLTVTAGDNDLLAYINPDCHSPYLQAGQKPLSGWKAFLQSALRMVRSH